MSTFLSILVLFCHLLVTGIAIIAGATALGSCCCVSAFQYPCSSAYQSPLGGVSPTTVLLRSRRHRHNLLLIQSETSKTRHYRHQNPNHQRQHQQHHVIKSCRGRTLFFSLQSEDSNNRPRPTGPHNNNRKKFPLPNPLTVAVNMVKSSIQIQANFRKKFATLSRKGKMIVSIQLMAIALFLGYGAKSVTTKVMSKNSSGAAVTVIQKPMEVPYSVFMDMVERSGKGHVPGQNPAMRVDQLVIGRENIGFKIKSDEEKHLLALKNQKLVESNDISIQKVKERRLYASKVNANPELIKFLRDNSIPFKAASTKGTNALSMIARSSIILIYMLFLLRMYRAISGGGGGPGAGGDTPGKLAKTLASDPKSMVKFEDIEGVDSAKFEGTYVT
jgi:ATP-dependent Zn proteases